MALIAIGDIHGCASTLDEMLGRLAVTGDDHLVFIGDYIDRGPASSQVIDRLLALREEVPCTFLRGNHEKFMLDFLDHGELDLWNANGGMTTLRSYLDEDRRLYIPEAHADFVRETQLFHDTPDFFFVHAGLDPDLSIAQNVRQHDEEVFLWERNHIEATHLAWEKPVVCGHTPRPEPINRELLIGIDTGCVYHTRPSLGRLTAVRLPEREFVQVEYAA